MIEHTDSACVGRGSRCSVRLALAEVRKERLRQDAKWGEQNHKDGTARWNKRHADYYRDVCDEKASQGQMTWLDILLEEVWEAGAEVDPEKLKTELIQVAAVCVAWLEAIDRRPKP